MKDWHFVFVLVMCVISKTAFHLTQNVGITDLEKSARMLLKVWILNMKKFTTGGTQGDLHS